jgi:hypothetical protein
VLVGLLALAPALHILIYLRGYLVNLPWWDEWDVSVIVASKTAAGTLTLGDLFSQQNEHIIFFTNLVTVALTRLTHWNVTFESYISFALTAVNLLILLDLFRRDRLEAFLLAAVPISALTFSIRQVFNWQFGFQTQFFFSVLWLMLAMWVLRVTAQGWRPVLIAAVLALFGTYSMSPGLMLWLALPLMMWLRGYRKPRYFIFWTLAAGAGFWSYFMLRHTADHIDTDPILLFTYFVEVMGGPLIWGNTLVAIILAVMMFVALAANLTYLWPIIPRERLAAWITLAAFGVGVGLLISAGRAHILLFDPLQSMESRYVTATVQCWIALLALMFMTLSVHARSGSPTRFGRVLSRVNVAFLGIVIGAHLIVNMQFYQHPQLAPALVARWQADCLKTYPQTHNRECLEGLHPDISVPARGMELAARYHLSLMSEVDTP